jgi:hypothetical protein
MISIRSSVVCLPRSSQFYHPDNGGNIFGEMKTKITSVRTQSHRDLTAALKLFLEVKDVDHLNRVCLSLRRLSDVLDIQRALGGREK